ncbi:hypothetical protein DLH72_00585 [Candidatus Gracilibacteria bacterium]|nr:MAG: hypothetical protein DLH72_00585 [Candidatus Gracilibacteria bacterium]
MKKGFFEMPKMRNKETLCSLEIVTIKGEEMILKLNDDGTSYLDGEILDVPEFYQIEDLIDHLKKINKIDDGYIF